MPTALPLAPTVPIACTLGAGDRAERTDWIATLNRTALRAHRRDGLSLVLDFAPGAAAQVRELVAREQECCAFLGFRVEERSDGVRLTVEAPPAARDATAAVFAPFVVGRPGAPSPAPG